MNCQLSFHILHDLQIFLVNLTLPEVEQHSNLSFTPVTMSQVIRGLSIKKNPGPNSTLGLWNYNLRGKSCETKLNLYS